MNTILGVASDQVEDRLRGSSHPWMMRLRLAGLPTYRSQQLTGRQFVTEHRANLVSQFVWRLLLSGFDPVGQDVGYTAYT